MDHCINLITPGAVCISNVICLSSIELNAQAELSCDGWIQLEALYNFCFGWLSVVIVEFWILIFLLQCQCYDLSVAMVLLWFSIATVLFWSFSCNGTVLNLQLQRYCFDPSVALVLFWIYSCKWQCFDLSVAMVLFYLLFAIVLFYFHLQWYCFDLSIAMVLFWSFSCNSTVLKLQLQWYCFYLSFAIVMFWTWDFVVTFWWRWS